DSDLLAAEYVLGTLDSEERTRAQVLLDVDGGFRGMVRIWERRLSELHLMVEPVEPAVQIWDRIKSKVPGVEQSKEGMAVAAPLPEPPKSPEVEPPEFDFKLDLDSELRASDTVVKAEPNREFVREPGPTMSDSTQALARIASRLEDPDTIPRRPEPPRPVRIERRGGGGWMALGVLMTLLVVVLGGLMAAWRFIPERLPPQLRATTILHIHAAPVRPPAPPG